MAVSSRASRNYVYAAYNAAPADLAATPEAEAAWYGRLRSEPLISGLELAFAGTLHPHGTARLAELLAPQWSSVISTVPVTMVRLAADETYGLASVSKHGRAAAITDVLQLCAGVAQLRDRLGETVVRAIALLSAPRANPGQSSWAFLADSLAEIASWDWGDAALCLEHADAMRPHHAPEKGFLNLQDEIRAVQAARERTARPIEQTINWGRSAIETRSATGPDTHCSELVASGTLGGLMISGAAPLATDASRAWEDAHLPMTEIEPASILGRAQLHNTLSVVGDGPIRYLGVKVGSPAGADRLEVRLAPGLAALDALHELRLRRG